MTEVPIVLAYHAAKIAYAICPTYVCTVRFADAAECEGHYVTKFAKRCVFADLYVAMIGNYYPISVLQALLVVVNAESVANVGVDVEELLERRRVGNKVFCVFKLDCKGIIYTAGHISALGTGRTVEGVLAVISAVIAVVDDPVVLTLVAAYRTVAVR